MTDSFAHQRKNLDPRGEPAAAPGSHDWFFRSYAGSRGGAFIPASRGGRPAHTGPGRRSNLRSPVTGEDDFCVLGAAQCANMQAD